MTSEQVYNGWTNYETWNVKLWMDNDQLNYDYWREQAEQFGKDDVHGLSVVLKDEHEENRPELTGTYADLLGAALSMVNWYEIAESLLSDIADESDSLVPDKATCDDLMPDAEEGDDEEAKMITRAEAKLEQDGDEPEGAGAEPDLMATDWREGLERGHPEAGR